MVRSCSTPPRVLRTLHCLRSVIRVPGSLFIRAFRGETFLKTFYFPGTWGTQTWKCQHEEHRKDREKDGNRKLHKVGLNAWGSHFPQERGIQSIPGRQTWEQGGSRVGLTKNEPVVNTKIGISTRFTRLRKCSMASLFPQKNGIIFWKMSRAAMLV